MIHLAVFSILLTLITAFATLTIAIIVYFKERNALFGHYLFEYLLVTIFVIIAPVAYYFSYFDIFPHVIPGLRLTGNLLICLFTSRCVWVEYPAKVSLRYRVLNLISKISASIIGIAIILSFFFFWDFFVAVRNVNVVAFLLGFTANFIMVRLEKNPVDYKDGFDWNRLTKTINMITMVVIIPVAMKWIQYRETTMAFLFKSWFPIIPVLYFITQLFSLAFLARSIIKPNYEIQSTSVHPEAAEKFGFSKREVEIAGRLIEGLSYKDIGSTLFISPETVKFHTKNIYRKGGVKKRQDLIRVLQNLSHFAK